MANPELISATKHKPGPMDARIVGAIEPPGAASSVSRAPIGAAVLIVAALETYSDGEIVVVGVATPSAASIPVSHQAYR